LKVELDVPSRARGPLAGTSTVGAVADNGETALELDIAADKTFPAMFTSR
jgi:hypothetical protein